MRINRVTITRTLTDHDYGNRKIEVEAEFLGREEPGELMALTTKVERHMKAWSALPAALRTVRDTHARFQHHATTLELARVVREQKTTVGEWRKLGEGKEPLNIRLALRALEGDLIRLALRALEGDLIYSQEEGDGRPAFEVALAAYIKAEEKRWHDRLSLCSEAERKVAALAVDLDALNGQGEAEKEVNALLEKTKEEVSEGTWWKDCWDLTYTFRNALKTLRAAEAQRLLEEAQASVKAADAPLMEVETPDAFEGVEEQPQALSFDEQVGSLVTPVQASPVEAAVEYDDDNIPF